MKIYRKASRNNRITENPFWITYSDLLSSLVMIFLILLVAFLAISNLAANKNKQLAAKVKALNIEQQAEQLSEIGEDLEKLKQKYPEIEIDRAKGEVKIQSQILFDMGKASLKEPGKQFLRRFMKDWYNILKKYHGGPQGIIDKFFIEGHADCCGTSNLTNNYFDNLTLTSQRAESVTKFILKDCDFSSEEVETLKYLISATGRSNIEAYREVKQKHPNYTPPQICKIGSPEQRNVTLKLTFVNPLLKWKQGSNQ